MRKPSSKTSYPEVGEGKRGEGGYFGYLLRQAAAAYKRRVEKAMADLGVTQPQFAVLTMLANYPGISNADLARLAVLTPQTVSAIIANLERAGLIVRRPHEVHGRIQHIELNQNGRRRLAECRKRVQHLERHLADNLSPDEAAVIRKWLVGLAAGHEDDASEG
jgi:DNA-binding MarR family transcriptional regulator